MDRLYYDQKNKVLFHIPNYYTNGTGILSHLIPNLLSAERVLRQFVPTGDIYASEIFKSRRYKSMWSFHIKCEECPVEAFKLSADTSMWDWIND